MGSNLVLVGMPGAGKTTVGALVGQLSGRVFVDLDDLIEERAGADIPALIESLGVPGFRSLEREALKIAAAQNNIVLATGGGAVLLQENRDTIRACGRVYFLTRDIENLSAAGRPLSMDIPKLYRERLPYYQEVCHIEIPNDAQPEDAARRILEEFQAAMG